MSEEDEERQRFEQWAGQWPFSKNVKRFDENQIPWGGQYRNADLEFAWEAWQEATRNGQV